MKDPFCFYFVSYEVALLKISVTSFQVHAARLKNSGQDVVIKVLKPGIEDILVADLNFVYIIARILEFINPELRRTSLVRRFHT